MALPQRADAPAGDVSLPGAAPAEGEGVGKYWIVIILWVAAFALMIAFEVFAAIFRR
jgi:hypothetical protein